MTDTFERNVNDTAHLVFAGLAPSRRDASGETAGQARRSRHLAPKEQNRLVRGLHSTVPILLVGSMAVSMNLTGPIEPASAKRSTGVKQGMTELGAALRDAMTAARGATPVAAAEAASVTTTAAPTTYRVVPGDTVSSIAGRYGLSTASVLALNGLSWSSLIFPGQTLKLTKGGSASVAPAKPSTPTADTKKYTIVSGDTVSRIAARFGVSTEAVLSANGLGWKSIIYPGQKLTIPGGSGSAPNSTPTPATPSTGKYTIVAGDTITKIAGKFGISVQALLDANGLKLSSTIYAGKTLTIPGIASASNTSGITPLTTEMRTNATIIIQVGRDLGVSDYGIVIALATAMQESTLRNLNWGDRDSIGLFQQRPSAGWGTVSAIMDPVHSSRLFYGGPTNPNKGTTRGLLDIAGWKSLTVTQAAQAVQISAYPNAYAKWEASARAWLAELG